MKKVRTIFFKISDELWTKFQTIFKQSEISKNPTKVLNFAVLKGILLSFSGLIKGYF